jgi:hypothetical protein
MVETTHVTSAAWGSVRVSRAAERVFAITDFSCDFPSVREQRDSKESLFRRDAETSTRNACAPQTQGYSVIAGSTGDWQGGVGGCAVWSGGAGSIEMMVN